MVMRRERERERERERRGAEEFFRDLRAGGVFVTERRGCQCDGCFSNEAVSC